jgi:hypothetical protein
MAKDGREDGQTHATRKRKIDYEDENEDEDERSKFTAKWQNGRQQMPKGKRGMAGNEERM